MIPETAVLVADAEVRLAADVGVDTIAGLDLDHDDVVLVAPAFGARAA